jgi:glycosyltransferase involved in cell wall biosynthesis
LFRRARELGADVLVTLDADGQHDPSEVSNVVKPIVEGKADVVVGSRFVDECPAYAMPWYRRAGVKLVTRLTNNVFRYGIKSAEWF